MTGIFASLLRGVSDRIWTEGVVGGKLDVLYKLVINVKTKAAGKRYFGKRAGFARERCCWPLIRRVLASRSGLQAGIPRSKGYFYQLKARQTTSTLVEGEFLQEQVSCEWVEAVGLQRRVCMDAAQCLSLHSSRHEDFSQACTKTCHESSVVACFLARGALHRKVSIQQNNTFLAKDSYR